MNEFKLAIMAKDKPQNMNIINFPEEIDQENNFRVYGETSMKIR